MSVSEANDQTFAGLIAENQGLILLDFWAPSCPPCIEISKILRELAPSFAGSMLIVKINADDSPETATSFGVRGLPTLVLLKNGKEHRRHIGGLNRARLESLLQDWLKS